LEKVMLKNPLLKQGVDVGIY